VVHISVCWGAKSLFDELDSIARLVWFFIKTYEYFSELIDNSSSFEVFSEFFFLLFSSLNAHFDYYKLT
jgi:hypothetical protein